MTGLGLQAARQFVQATEDEWPRYFERLRRNRQLFPAIHQIHHLLDQPEYRPLAIGALTRICLWHEAVSQRA